METEDGSVVIMEAGQTLRLLWVAVVLVVVLVAAVVVAVEVEAVAAEAVAAEAVAAEVVAAEVEAVALLLLFQPDLLLFQAQVLVLLFQPGLLLFQVLDHNFVTFIPYMIKNNIYIIVFYYLSKRLFLFFFE